jgi:actin-related protein 8
MVGKKSGKAQLREEGMSLPCLSLKTNVFPEGLEKTDNNLAQTSWPVISMINQKNYYTYEVAFPV